ncbi:hypothetical protein [Aureimonas altamirensis]|uniref:hypothetical protein n=1 Tax=Aureimonas altamirensis TaxID=370622 RepID=UPI003016CC99
MQFEEDRIYSAVEIADFRNTLIEKYDYKIHLFEARLQKAYGLSLSKFRQHPDSGMEIVLFHHSMKPTVIHPAVPVFGKDRIRNGADKLVSACADVALSVFFDKLPGDEGYLYSDKEIAGIELIATKSIAANARSTMTPITQNGVVRGFQYNMNRVPSAVKLRLATAI